MSDPLPADQIQISSPMYRPLTHLSATGAALAVSQCPRKAFYIRCGLKSYAPEDTPIPMFFGTSMHGGIPLSGQGYVDAAMEAFLEVWGDREGDERGRTPLRARKMFEDYAKHMSTGLYRLVKPPPSTAEHSDRDRSPFEFVFSLDIGLPIPVVGYIDAIMEQTTTGQRFPVDYKTSSIISGLLLEAFTGSPQPTTYVMASQMNGIDCDHCLYQLLRTSKTKVETMSHPVPVTPVHLQDLIAWYYVQWENIQMCESLSRWPKNRAACTPQPQFGCSWYRCDYWELCERENWEDAVDMYHVHPEHRFISPSIPQPEKEPPCPSPKS